MLNPELPIAQGPPYIVGITGPIGSGKSTFCHHLERLGYPVYYSDTRAIALIEHDPALKGKVSGLLGSEAFTAEGAYRRDWVGRRVFDDPELLNALNAAVHPAVAHEILGWSAQLFQTQPMQRIHIVESALLTTPYWRARVHALVSILAGASLRSQRVAQRDRTAPTAVAQRMARQPQDAAYRAISDLTLTNDHDTPGLFLREATERFTRFLTQHFNLN